MRGEYPWVYVDSENNKRIFYIDKKDDLYYKTLYSDGKCSRESLIAHGVLGLGVYIEENESIHIVYSTKKNELKYCTERNNQWLGKMLYNIDRDDVQIDHIKVEIVGQDLFIFYLKMSMDGSEHAALMNCRWNGQETIFEKLEDIIMLPNTKEHFVVHVREKDLIDVFYIIDEGNEVSLMHCSHKNGQWLNPSRLYGIHGDKISFDVINTQKEIHLLNHSREHDKYFLDHVCIDLNGELQHSQIYNSSNEIKESLLFTDKNKLYCCMLEQNDIFYASYESGKWSKPFPLEITNGFSLEKYNWLNNGRCSIKARRAYGMDKPASYQFFPQDFINNEVAPLEQLDNSINLAFLNEELDRVNALNMSLQKKIDSCQMELQKKQHFAELCQENIAKVTAQKRKAEENINVFIEVQKNKQADLDKTKQLLSEEKILSTSLQSKLKDREYENTKLRKQYDFIVEENKKLHKELEEIKNQSFMGRLFK